MPIRLKVWVSSESPPLPWREPILYSLNPLEWHPGSVCWMHPYTGRMQQKLLATCICHLVRTTRNSFWILKQNISFFQIIKQRYHPFPDFSGPFSFLDIYQTPSVYSAHSCFIPSSSSIQTPAEGILTFKPGNQF